MEKTLQEIKDEVAVKNEYSSWESLETSLKRNNVYDKNIMVFCDEVSIKFAEQALRQALRSTENGNSVMFIKHKIESLIKELK
jgi:hypothetical protein